MNNSLGGPESSARFPLRVPYGGMAALSVAGAKEFTESAPLLAQAGQTLRRGCFAGCAVAVEVRHWLVVARFDKRPAGERDEPVASVAGGQMGGTEHPQNDFESAIRGSHGCGKVA
jgi:hypothetical protein